MRKTFALFALLALAGCAEQVMNSYVGQDVTQAVLDYGPPANVFDMPDGRRAFQWQMTKTGVMPSTTTLNANRYGNTVYGTATTTGGYAFQKECAYTLFGTANPRNSYTITGYQKPRVGCL